jgi:thiamine transporter ThiT
MVSLLVRRCVSVEGRSCTDLFSQVCWHVTAGRMWWGHLAGMGCGVGFER